MNETERARQIICAIDTGDLGQAQNAADAPE